MEEEINAGTRRHRAGEEKGSAKTQREGKIRLTQRRGDAEGEEKFNAKARGQGV